MKSKGIYGLSKIIIESHNGEVPQSFSALEALPSSAIFSAVVEVALEVSVADNEGMLF